MSTRLTLVTLLAGLLSWAAPTADASCHAFTVGASSSVAEGAKATVVIERDGSVADSSVRVRTRNGTATAPSDFTAVDQRVSFTGTQVSRTIQVHTQQDDKEEGNEAFTVEVLEGQGCPTSGGNFDYGGAATVTITDDDGPTPTPEPTIAPTPIRTTSRPPTPAPTSSATPTPSPSDTPGGTTTPSPTPSATTTVTPFAEEDDDSFPWAPVGLSLGTIAIVAGALVLYRLRQATL